MAERRVPIRLLDNLNKLHYRLRVIRYGYEGKDDGLAAALKDIEDKIRRVMMHTNRSDEERARYDQSSH